MTDLSHHPASSIWSTPSVERMRPWLPFVCFFAGTLAGAAAGHAMAVDTSGYESKLVLLLRFMAIVKGMGVLLAAAVLTWRLTKPIGRRAVTTYCGALFAMALAPGLIWSLGGIASGALLFHAGLLAFLALAWADRGAHPRRTPDD